MVDKTQAWDTRLRNVLMVVARLGLAYLFFANLWWKMPPDFGCGKAFTFPVLTADGKVDASKSGGGLCYWLGLETVYAPRPRQVLVADMYPIGVKWGINIAPIAQLNALFINTAIKPNLAVTGYLIWGAEALIFVSLLLGLFTRLGGLVAIGISLQLFIGLANIPSPYEWEWGYGQMVLLSLLMFGLAPGRVFGVDGWLRASYADSSSAWARLVRLLT